MKRIFLVFAVVISIMTCTVKVYAKTINSTNAEAKINHLIWSIKNNYLGIKNQAQWEIYIKESKDLMKLIPLSESREKNQLTNKLNKAEIVVNSVARVNQVEKSMEKNFHGIKNAKQWNQYIKLANEESLKIDRELFKNERENLNNRIVKCKKTILSIEEEFEKEYSDSLALYTKARGTMIIKDANEALSKAIELGTCEESNELEKKCNVLINNIKTLTIDIKSVSIKNNTYDDDRENQVITILVNDEVINTDFLKAAGYRVEFSAKDTLGEGKDIFINGSTSETGALKDKLTKGEYYVTATLTKGKEVYKSEESKINIINLDFNVSSIKGYAMKNLGQGNLEDNGFVQSSNVLVVGERARISSLEVLIENETCIVSSDITVKSKDENIIAVENNIIKAKSIGRATLTLSFNGVSKDVDIEVKDESRKIDLVEAKDLDIITGKSKKIMIKTIDQYGDPINYKGVVVSIQGEKQIKEANIEYKEDNKATLEVKAGDTAGAGVIYLKDEKGRLLKSIQVNVSKVDNVENLRLDIKSISNEEYSSDNIIFPTASDKDKYIKYSLSQISSEDINNGVVNLKGYTIMYDKNLLSISGQENGEFQDVEAFTVSAKKSGESDVVIFYPSGRIAARAVVKVLDYENSIESIKWNVIDNINYAGEKISANSVLDVIESSNDNIINGIILKSHTPYKIRMIKSSNENSNICTGTLYIDKDSNGIYGKGDVKIGSISGKYIDRNQDSLISDIDVSSGMITKRNDNGIVVFTLTNSDGSIISTTNIKINIK